MFRLFKKVSEVEKLNKKYKALLKEAHTLSTTNRNESDKKQAEAQLVLEQIQKLESNK